MAQPTGTTGPDGLGTDITDVKPDILTGNQPISLEDAISAQVKEYEALAQSQELEETEEPEEEAPEEADTPEEVVAEPAEEETDEEAEEEIPEYLFEVQGKGIDLEEAKNGYLRQDNFTTKTQNLAEQRKQYEAMQQQLMQEREFYVTGLQRAKALEDALRDEPDWGQLSQSDPQEYLQARAEWDEVQKRRQVIDDAIVETREKQEKDYNTALQAHVNREAASLLDKAPELKDTEASQQFHGKVHTYLQTKGFSEEDIGQLNDHRLYLILKDAMAGQAVSTSAPIAKKKVAKAKKGITRGKRSAKQTNPELARIQQAHENLSQSGNLEDAIEAQMAEMGLPYDRETMS